MLVKYEKLVNTKLVGRCAVCRRKLYSSEPVRRLGGRVLCVAHPINLKKEEK